MMDVSAIGVPLGIWAAHSAKVWRVTQPILDLMQTMPTFVYLIPILILFGLGAAPALIVTIIFAMPAPVRMTYLGITSIPRPMIEAGEAFGATGIQHVDAVRTFGDACLSPFLGRADVEPAHEFLDRLDARRHLRDHERVRGRVGHHGAARPEVKNSVVLDPARRINRMAGTNDSAREMRTITQSRVVSCTAR